MKKNLLAGFALMAALFASEQAAAQTQAYVQWPLRRNNQDSVQIRKGSVTPNTPVLKRYVLADPNALSVAAGGRAPYSSIGQAFGVAADGSGFSTAVPGGPRRAYYEQFSITATAATRVDSLVLGVRGASSANGTMAASYSLNGFATDSIDFASAKGPVVVGSSSANSSPGGVLAATANGSFGTVASDKPAAAPAFVPQNNAANPKDDFHFAFTGTGNGLTLAAGQTLTVRLYFRVGSNTAGRYILLHDVTIKSLQAYVPVILSAKAAVAKQALNVYPNPAQENLQVAHPAAKKGATVAVYSFNGQKVASFAAQPNTTSTDVRLSALTAGMYMVEYSDGEQRITSKIVKQ